MDRCCQVNGWSCSVPGQPFCVDHFVFVLSGRPCVVLAGATELDLAPGDGASVPAGHDAWGVGEEPYVFVEFDGDLGQELLRSVTGRRG
jgi:hypothetical protein